MCLELARDMSSSIPDTPLRRAIRYVSGGGTDPGEWRDLTPPELIELLLHAPGRTPASVVNAINARLADLVAAESVAAAKVASLRSTARESRREVAGRRNDTLVLIAVLGLLAGVTVLFLQ